MKKKVLMFVYSNIKTDARVMRAVSVLKEEYDLTLLATAVGPSAQIDGFKFVDVVNNNIKNSLIRYVDCLLKVFQYILKHKPDIIYGHDYYAAPIAAFSRKKIRYIYDAHELYVADKNSSIRKRICCAIEKKAIENADLVICASDQRKKIMETIYSAKNEIVVVNNISLLPQNKMSEETRRNVNQLDAFFGDDRKAVVYCGVLIKARNIGKLLYSAKALKNQIKVLIIGSGEEKEKLLKIRETENLDNCFFIDSVPYSDVRSLISKCDVGYIYYENDTLNNINCAPNKIYEYASAGLPMVANNNPRLEEVFHLYGIGETSERIPDAIEKVLSNYDQYKSALDGFLQDCSWEKECIRLKKAIADSCK